MSTIEAEMKKVVDQATKDRPELVAALTRDQLAEALRQALECGDFQRLVIAPKIIVHKLDDVVFEHRQTVTYIPAREVSSLKARVAELEELLSEVRALAKRLDE